MTTKQTLMSAAFATAMLPLASQAAGPNFTTPVEIDANNLGIPEILLSPGGEGNIVVQGNDGVEDFKVEGTTGNVSTEGTLVVKGTALVNDTLTVQPEMTTVVGPTTVTPGSGTPTDLTGTVGGSGGPVKIIQTIIDTNEADQTTVTGGGFTAETNGDATLKSVASKQTTVNYGRTVTQEVAQAGNANPVGVAIPGTEKYYLTRPDGTIIAGAGPFPSEAALDAFIGGLTPEDILALDATLGSTVDLAGSGGNLQVGGNANVDGTLSLGDTGSGAVADVAAAINGNAAAIVAGDAATLAAANTYADSQDDAHSTADRAYADSQDDAHSTADRAYADSQDDAHSTADRAYADAQDDAHSTADRAYADSQDDAHSTADRAYADSQDDAHSAADRAYTDAEVLIERNNRIAADDILQNQINTNAGAIANNASNIRSNKKDIQTNTRGIAMVAAMTNTTVLPGNTQAIDFNLSHFEGETGFGFGYARAVNPNLQLKIAVASTTDFDESVVRAGVSYQW